MRDAYDGAMAKTRTKKRLLVAGVGGTFVPERVEWLHAEMVKTLAPSPKVAIWGRLRVIR